MNVKGESEKVGLKLSIQKTKIMASCPITLWQIDGRKMEMVADFIFLVSKITVDYDCSHEIKRRFLLGRFLQPRQYIKKQIHHFADKDQSFDFSSIFFVQHFVQWLWELDHKEGWMMKNWCFPTLVLEKSLYSPSDSKEIKSVTSKENQPWIFIGKTDGEAEAPILWSPDAKSWLIGKALMLERLRAGGERSKRAWNDWITSLTQWPWLWANSGRQWRIVKPGLLQCMGSQRFKHDLAIEHKQQIWIQPNYSKGESILKIKVEIHLGLLSRGVGLSFLLLYNIPLIFSLCVNKGY